MEASHPPMETVHWEAVLRPHCSLPPSGFLAVMLTLAGASFVAGIVFVMLGAWPVCGFLGLDILLVYFAFRLNYRGAGRREVLRLQGGNLIVERIDVRGECRCRRMQAFWLRVELVEIADGDNRLLLTTHGRSLPVGEFLTSEERKNLATELAAALRGWRAEPS